MAKRIFIVSISFLLLNYIISTDLSILEMGNNNNYGRYRLSMDKVETCNHKHNQAQKQKVSDVAIAFNNETGKVHLNISILTPCRLQDNYLVGCQQGDSLGPAIFSFAIYPTKSYLYSKFNVWYLEDATLGGDPDIVIQDLEQSKSKIVVERVNGNTRQMIVRYNIRNPCTHFAMIAILKTIVKINQKCVIEKGFYSAAVDLQKTAEAFVGKNYFYEDFAFLSVLRCANGVFLCTEGLVASRKLV